MNINPIFYENVDGKFILLENDAIARTLLRGVRWEPHFSVVVNEFVSPGDNVVDCGANFGYNSVILGKKITNSGVLISIEPQSLIYKQLISNLFLNGILNTKLVNSCIGEESNQLVRLQRVNYNQDNVNIGNTGIGGDGELCNVISLDDLCDVKINFIKIDVQGYELFLLKGAKNIISRDKPDLFIEIEDHQLIRFGIHKKQIIDLLKDHGYKIFNICNEYPFDYICTINNLHKIELLKDKLNLKEIL